MGWRGWPWVVTGGRQLFMLLILERCSMTGSAQQALRRTMELFSSTTRFALACNTSGTAVAAAAAPNGQFSPLPVHRLSLPPLAAINAR